MKIPTFEETAAEHKVCDESLGRPWQCTCAACIRVREGMSKDEWIRLRGKPKTNQRDQKVLQQERIGVLAEFGIKAVPGPWASSITLGGSQVGKLITLLKRLKKKEGK